jgi:Bacterial SH3 domain
MSKRNSLTTFRPMKSSHGVGSFFFKAAALVAVLVLAGCSSGDGDASSSTTTAEVTAPEATTAEPSTSMTEPPITSTSSGATSTSTPPTTTTESAEDTTTAVTVRAATYRVAFVEDGANGPDGPDRVPDVLNVRSAPNAGAGLVGTLSPGDSGITITGASELSGVSSWVPIRSSSGLEGWVNRRFLVEDVGEAEFCAGVGPSEALGDFVDALVLQSDDAMTSVVDAGRGVWLTLDGNPPFDPVRASARPFGEPARTWYIADGSGEAVTGTYADVVRPLLLPTLNSGLPVTCNRYDVGGSAGFTALAMGHEWANYLAVHDPPDPVQPLDWSTVVVGFDRDEAGDWVVVSVVRFAWTI